MLILTRGPGDTIHLEIPGQPPIVLHCLHAHGAVKLGIDAPPAVRVRRGELLPHTPSERDEVAA